MSHSRVGRCPACRSDQVTVMAVGNPKAQTGLRLILGFAAGLFVLGLMLTPGSDPSPSVEAFSSGIRFLCRWIVAPAAGMVCLIYFLNKRGLATKRLCRDCGKKWKVRSRSHTVEKSEASSQPG